MPDIFDRLAESPAQAGGHDIFDRVADDNAARAYRLLNEPDPELLDLAHRMGAQLAALKGRAPAPRQDPAYTPDLPMQFIGPEPAGAMTPMQAAQAAQDRGRPGERHWKALLHGVQGSATVLPARMKLPDALEPGQVPDLTTGERLAMQAGTLAGDFPLMVFGALLGAGSTIETGPGAVAGAAYGAWALPAGVRKVYMDRIEQGEVKSFGEFAFRLASAVDHANRSGFVGLATAGVGQAARAAGPLVSLPAEVATMTAAGAAFEGRVPDVQEFADAALLVGGLHAATATARAVGRVRASFDLAGKLRDIYARTGKRPAEVALEAERDPGLREHLLSEGEGLPPEYEKIAREQEALAKGYDRVKSDPLGGPADEVLATIEPADIERVIMERGPAIERDGQIVVSGRPLERETGSKSGFGMVKIIWKHGEEGGKQPEHQVRKDDVVELPKALRDYLPILDDAERTVWRYPTEDGRHILVSAKKGISSEGSRTVTMFVDTENVLPVSQKRGAWNPSEGGVPPKDTGQERFLPPTGGPDPLPHGKNDITTPGAEIKPPGQDAPSPYFKPTEGSVRVPLDALVAREAPSAERLAHAHELMDAAKAGTGEAREPLQVRDVGGGRYQVVEGNTSLHALRERGETHAVAQVVGPGERGHAGVQTLDQAYEQAAAALPGFVAAVRDIAGRNGAAVSFRDGLKGRERAEAKAKRSGPGMIRDLVCGTVIARDQAGIRSILDAVGKSFEIVRVKDKFAQPQADGYRDMLVNVRTPNGHVAEIQVSTREMAEAKSLLGHKIYNVTRELQELPESPEVRGLINELNGVSRQYYDAVAGGKSAIASAREIGIPAVQILARFSGSVMRSRAISSAVESLRTTLNTLPVDSSTAQGMSSQSRKVSSMAESPAPGKHPEGNANITPPAGGGKAPAQDGRSPLAALSDAADRAGEGMDSRAGAGIESAHEVQERGGAAGGPGPAAQDGLGRPQGGGRPVPGVRSGEPGAGAAGPAGEPGGHPGGAARGRAVAVIHSEGDVPAHYEVREAAAFGFDFANPEHRRIAAEERPARRSS